MQVFFTIALAMWRTGERLKPHQLAAFALALAGMGVIAAHSGAKWSRHHARRSCVWCCWRRWAGPWATRPAAKRPQTHRSTCWPMWCGRRCSPCRRCWRCRCCWRVRPPSPQAWPAPRRLTWAAVLWQSVGNTMFGYACWAWLLSRYPAATIAPVSLLVPVFGFGASALLLGEPLPSWKIVATAADHGGPGGEFAVAARARARSAARQHDARPIFPRAMQAWAC